MQIPFTNNHLSFEYISNLTLSNMASSQFTQYNKVARGFFDKTVLTFNKLCFTLVDSKSNWLNAQSNLIKTHYHFVNSDGPAQFSRRILRRFYVFLTTAPLSSALISLRFRAAPFDPIYDSR